ncbi:ATP-binding protein [Vampirovibrio chlorellavorus]|uniref:ATP-binding protein n=1 Tax=Vampirovibrio chlorellavorus TaxID=758823 RepID=UPI0026ECAC37|nr:ATP-binding protein [Vampirovibrio chlorellavorus]
MWKAKVFSSENKILLLVITSISVSFLIVAFGIYTNYNNSLADNYDRFANMITEVVSVGGVERLSSSNPEFGVKRFADDMVAGSEDIAAIEFYDKSGRLIYKSAKPLSVAESKTMTDYVAPLRRVLHDDMEPEEVGTVHVKLTGKTLRDIKVATGNIIIWVFLSAWFISVLAVSLNTYILSKHLRTFVRGVKRLSTGDFGYKILEHDLWGELKTLAESFNDMSMRLRAYEDQNLETITFERNKLKAILLSIADGVVVCDMQAKVAIINDAACDMLGYKSSEWALGSNLKDYTTESGTRCFEPIIADFEKVLADKQTPLPPLFIHKLEVPGTTLKIMLSPIQDTEGDMLGFVLIMHDVTKETEVDKMKTSFISNVSHELRTPVTTIKSYVDTIYNHGKDLDAETYDEFIETINTETDRLKKLVNDILDFSRLDEGAVVLERELADMTPVINLTVQSVKVLADQKKITLSTAIESGLPKLYINSDSIERVLRNLLSNAIKYTDEGGRIRVRAEVTEIGDALEVSVQDTGSGIAEEHLPHLFDRFYRVENKVHTVKGTGLGLHLVKVAIENHHGGEVFVKSEVGVGSTFGFRIPLGEPGADLPGEGARALPA